MEAISIYSNNILHAYKEASSALRLARMIVEVGPLSYANVFERHTKVRSRCAFKLFQVLFSNGDRDLCVWYRRPMICVWAVRGNTLEVETVSSYL